jgi:hypothetical protein
MADARAKHEVDPNRFTGKTFTRSSTFPGSVDDYRVKIDGLTAGRTMKKKFSYQRVAWCWYLTAPHYPLQDIQYGEEETYEAARDAFNRLFWHWHAWALKQQGPVTWYGAIE